MKISHNRTAARRLREQAQRRQAILEAAREVFFEKGFREATIEAIAHRCDLAKGTIYLYFQSKEELYVSIMAEGLELLKNDLSRVGERSLPCDRLLGEALDLYYAFYQNNPKYFRIMFLSSQPDVRKRVPDALHRQCMERAGECMEILSRLIEKGVRQGVFRAVSPWTFAVLLWSTVNGIIMHYEQGTLYRNEILKLPLEEMLHEALDLALNGLRAELS